MFAGSICSAKQAADPTDWNYGQPMLPPGKYVVEMIVPPGYELVKEEDKNILMGDSYDAPVTELFAGFGNILIHARLGCGGRSLQLQQSSGC